MKKPALLLLITLLILPFLLYSQEKPEHQFDLVPGAIELDRDIEMNDSLYSADSAYIFTVAALGGKLFRQQRFEEQEQLILRDHARIRDLLEYRFDTSLFELYAGCFGSLAWTRGGQGKYDGNVELSEKGLQLYADFFGKDHQRYNEGCVMVGYAYQQIGDYEQAIKYNLKAFTLALKNYPPGHRLGHYAFNKLRNITIIYREIGDYESTIYYGIKLISLAKKQKNDFQELYSLINLGFDYLENNQGEKAVELENEIDKLFYQYRKNDDVYFFLKRNYLMLKSRLFFEKGNINKAMEMLEKYNTFIEERKSEESYFQSKFTYLNQKATYQKSLDIGEAINIYEELLSVIQKNLGERNERLFDVYRDLAHCYVANEDFEQALKVCQNLLSIFDAQFREENLYDIPNHIENNFSLPFLKALVYKAETLIQYANRKNNDLKLYKLGLETLLHSEKLLEALRWEANWQISQLKMGKWSSRIADNYIYLYLKLFDLTGDEKYLEKAFEQSQQNKSALFLAGLQEAKVKSYLGLPDSILEKEEEYKKRISILRKQIYDVRMRENPNDSLLGAWETRLLEKNNEYLEFQENLKQQYPKYHQLKYELPVYSVAEIQRTLDPDEALIEYFVGDSSTYAFLVSPTNYKVVELNAEKIKGLYLQLQGQLYQHQPAILSDQEQQIQFDQFSKVVYGLYQELMYPVLADTKAAQLYIIPDGYLGLLPFHILLTSPPSETQKKTRAYPDLAYLFKDYTPNQEYAIQLLMDRKGTGKRGNSIAYAGFAPTYTGEELAANRNMDTLMFQKYYPEIVRNGLSGLAFNQPEVDTVAGFFPSGKAFLGSDATEENFKTYGLEAKVLHLAMHALTNDENPLFSQLIFTQNERDTAEDGFLHAYELYNTQLNAELAVLSACNTGAGRFAKGEGVLSLSRAFKYAGCPNIAMSLWKADDQATHEIMVNFFKNLKVGKGKSASLKEAQLTYLNNHTGAKTHPYYWATFVMIGDDAPLSSGGMPWWGWAGLIVVAGLIGWGVWRRRRAVEP